MSMSPKFHGAGQQAPAFRVMIAPGAFTRRAPARHNVVASYRQPMPEAVRVGAIASAMLTVALCVGAGIASAIMYTACFPHCVF